MNRAKGNSEHDSLHPDRWVAEHADILFRYALLRVQRADVAEDLVQETFLAALRGRHQFNRKSSVRTWLVGILRHKILDHYRHIAREQPSESTALEEETNQEFFDAKGHWKVAPAEWKTDPQQLSENREFWAVFLRCLEELSEVVAHAFVLRELQENKTEEICKVLEISETNLWVRLHRARLQLRRCLELNWFVDEE